MVLAFVSDEARRCSLHELARSGNVGISFCASLRQLGRLLARKAPELLLLDLSFLSSGSVADVIRRFWAARPDARIIVLCPRLDPPAARQILVAGRVGISDVAFEETGDLVTLFAGLAVRRRETSAVFRVRRDVAPFLPQFGCELLDAYSIAVAPSVTQLAARVGMNRYTLVRKCAAEGLPSPRALLRWYKVITAAALLEERRQSVNSTAKELGYSSAQAFRASVRGVSGVSVQDLRAPNGFARLLDRFARIVESECRVGGRRRRPRTVA